MLKFKKYAGLLCGFVLIFMGCEKYLTVIPDDRTTLDSKEKIEELLGSAYNGTLLNAFVEPMTDNVDDEGRQQRYERVNDLAYRWEPNEIDDNRDSPIAYWVSAFRAIAVANQALTSINEMGDGPELRESKGEALLIRAYYHFMVANLWAQHYAGERSGDLLGIPYVTDPETDPFKQYSRLTLAEVYERIETDLTEGMSLVGKNYPVPKFRFTPEAAKAFAVRFYLFKGGDDSWPKVIQYANELLTNPGGQIRDWSGKYRTLGTERSTILYSATEEPANIMVAAGNSIYWRTIVYANPRRFAMSVGKYFELFSASTNPFGLNWSYGAAQYGVGDIVSIAKFSEHFVITNPAAQVGLPYTGWVTFSYDEVLLSRAEAYVMTDRFEEARQDMTLFFSKRLNNFPPSAQVTDAMVVNTYPVQPNELTPWYPLSAQQENYLKAVTSLRKIDFVHEGLRWFDIKRFNMEVTHEIIGETTLTLVKDDPKRAMQIPPSAVDGGLAPNPR